MSPHAAHRFLSGETSADRSADPGHPLQGLSRFPAVVFAGAFVFLYLLHLPLLQLPYFWDEAGYYIPAARDIFLSGSLIPHATVSNAHPPLVMAWLALWWKLFGYAPLVTRTAMLVIAAFSMVGVFRLGEAIANTEIGVASALCTGLYPVFFAQSSLAHVDLAAAGFTFWALSEFVERRFSMAAIFFSLAPLAKETAILAPLALALWDFGRTFAPRTWRALLWEEGEDRNLRTSHKPRGNRLFGLLFPIVPLAAWYAYHYSRTGYVFGNPEFFRYNVAGTLNPVRFLLALVLRLWQVLGYLHLWILTGATFAAMRFLRAARSGFTERPRIPLPLQMYLYVVITAYVLSMALIGGAVLARYMLPAVPLVILLCVSTFWRRMRFWRLAIAGVALAFIAAWFWYPHYGFSPEDNLAYRDYILLHEDGERFLEARYPMARVLTAWPASDELARPWLGYNTRPMQVVRIEDFSLPEMKAAAGRAGFEVALIFSTKYEPGPAPWDRWTVWNKWKSRFFGFHRDLPPAAAAQLLGGRIVFSEQRQGQWIAVIEER